MLLRQSFFKIFNVLIILIFVLLPLSRLGAQNRSNLRTRWITPKQDSIRLDSLSVVPNTLSFYKFQSKQLIPVSMDSLPQFTFNLANSTLIFKGKHDSLLVKYRLMNFDLSKPLFLYVPTLEKSNFSKSNLVSSNLSSYIDQLMDESLIKDGSLTRGFSLGSNNDLGMSSRLNLQLSGQLNANTKIVGTISDENIPIQADGTSQRLQEFDKIFLKISSSKYSLSAGDLLIEKNDGYFLNPNKKIKGLEVGLNFQGQDSSNLDGWQKAKLGVGIAKGKFARYLFQAQEGVQGPYQLQGANGQKYIVVLSGSERVFVNGKQMERGQDKDYTIDYNSAQLKFTYNCMMTSEKRIVVEFEFSDLQYMRVLVLVAGAYKYMGRSMYLNYFREQDAKSQSLSTTLDDSTKQIFANSNTKDSRVWINTAQKTAYSESEILYVQKDSLLGGLLFERIYVQSNSKVDALFRLRFTKLGEHMGNYIRTEASLNGHAYKWVAPVNNVPQGDYVPMIQMASPQQKEVLNFGMEAPKNGLGLGFEIALSRMNFNTFSLYKETQTTGLAIKLNYGNAVQLKDTSKKLNWKQSYEFTTKNFITDGEYRSPEYGREWNVKEVQNNGTHLLSLGVEFCKQKKIIETIQFSTMLSDAARKFKISSIAKVHTLLDWDRNTSVLLSMDSIYKTLFLKNELKIQKKTKKINLSLNFEQEYKKETTQLLDSLSQYAWRFEALEASLQNKDSLNLWRSSYKIRQDFIPQKQEFSRSSWSQDYNLNYKRAKNLFFKNVKTIKSEFSISLVFRQLVYEKNLNKIPENNLLGRFEHRLVLWHGLLVSNWMAETNSILAQKKDFIFVEVPTAQGLYRWTDYNKNTLKEIGEFEISTFKDEAKYIKIQAPTDTYDKAYQSKFNLTARIQPAAVWQKNKGIQKLVARFSMLANLKLDQNLPIAISVFDFLKPNEQANSSNFLIRNLVNFNKATQLWSGEYVYQNTQTASNFVSGKEVSHLQMHNLNIRLNLNSLKLTYKLPIQITQNTEYGNKTYQSESYALRNYQLNFLNSDLKTNYQIATSSGLSLQFKYLFKYESSSKQQSEQQLYSIEWNLSKIKSPLKLKMQMSYNKAQFSGEADSPLTYIMLDGLKTGSNYLWEINIEKTIYKNFQIGVLYQGRASNGVPVIHWGNVQARANF